MISRLQPSHANAWRDPAAYDGAMGGPLACATRYKSTPTRRINSESNLIGRRQYHVDTSSKRKRVNHLRPITLARGFDRRPVSF